MSEQYMSKNLHDTYNFIMKHVTKSMLFIQIIVKKISTGYITRIMMHKCVSGISINFI